MPHPHTAEVISEVLHDVLTNWRIAKKVSTMILDNCSTNNNVMKEMQYKMPLSSLMLKGKLMHMRCQRWNGCKRCNGYKSCRTDNWKDS